MKNSMACLLSCVFAALLVGCGGEEGPQPPATVQVSGSVTLDDQLMQGGEVWFHVIGQPAKVLEVQDGAFSGEVFVGQNRIAVVWQIDGPPNPMDPTTKLTVNKVDPRFSGAETPFNKDISPSGASDLQFAVTSARNEPRPGS